MRRPERAESAERPVIGILSPGEMGSALGAVLRSRGFEIVTTLAERSERSISRSGLSSFAVLDSIGSVVSRSDILVSLVPPAAATSVAQRVADELAGRRRPMTYLDCNSVSPATMAQISRIFERHDVALVDGGIHGLASRLAIDATLYLSGPDSEEVAAVLGGPPRIVVLGDEIGRASLLKLLVGGLAKGVVSLMVELSAAAMEDEIIDEYWGVCRTAYPGLMELFERLLPTYEEHALRRAQEMAELESALFASGVAPVITASVRTVLQFTAESPAVTGLLVDRLERRLAIPGRPVNADGSAADLFGVLS